MCQVTGGGGREEGRGRGGVNERKLPLTQNLSLRATEARATQHTRQRRAAQHGPWFTSPLTKNTTRSVLPGGETRDFDTHRRAELLGAHQRRGPGPCAAGGLEGACGAEREDAEYRAEHRCVVVVFVVSERVVVRRTDADDVCGEVWWCG